MKKNFHRGLTLIEAAMVLAIATLVVAGIMIFFQNASTNSKSNEVLSQIAHIQESVRSIYAGSPTYAGLENSLLISGGYIANKNRESATVIKNSFNGTVNVAPESIGVTDNTFSVEITGIPNEGCIKIASFDFGTGIYEFQIAGTTMTWPIAKADVIAQCNVGQGNNTTLKWIYKG